MNMLVALSIQFGFLFSVSSYATPIVYGNCGGNNEVAEREGLIKLGDRSLDLLRDLAAETNGAAESASVNFHQDNLLRYFTIERLLASGMNHRTARNFREAIVHSDIGKLQKYKQWLYGENAESFSLLSSLQLKGEGPLANLLRDINGGRPFINPNLSINVLRQIFKKAFFLISS